MTSAQKIENDNLVEHTGGCHCGKVKYKGKSLLKNLKFDKEF